MDCPCLWPLAATPHAQQFNCSPFWCIVETRIPASPNPARLVIAVGDWRFAAFAAWC